MNYALNELFRAAFSGASKGEVVARILGKVLLVCVMFLAGCATNRESATGPFCPTRTLTESSGEYGDEISYWDGAGLSGKPRIVIDLEQQRAAFETQRRDMEQQRSQAAAHVSTELELLEARTALEAAQAEAQRLTRQFESALEELRDEHVNTLQQQAVARA